MRLGMSEVEGWGIVDIFFKTAANVVPKKVQVIISCYYSVTLLSYIFCVDLSLAEIVFSILRSMMILHMIL